MEVFAHSFIHLVSQSAIIYWTATCDTHWDSKAREKEVHMTSSSVQLVYRELRVRDQRWCWKSWWRPVCEGTWKSRPSSSKSTLLVIKKHGKFPGNGVPWYYRNIFCGKKKLKRTLSPPRSPLTSSLWLVFPESKDFFLTTFSFAGCLWTGNTHSLY